MKTIAWLWVTVALAGCDPKGPQGPKPPPVASPLQCTPVTATRVDGPPGAVLYNLYDRYVLFLAACLDLAPMQQAVSGCASENGCGVAADPAAFTELITHLEGLPSAHARLGSTSIDVYRPQGSTVFVFPRSGDPVAVVGAISAQPAIPGPSTGGTVTPTSSATGGIPCCPTCAWCVPGPDQPQCPGVGPPPPPPPPAPLALLQRCGDPAMFCDAFKRAGSPASCQCATDSGCP